MTKPIEEMGIDELLVYRRPRTSDGGYWHDDDSLVHAESFSELARRYTDLRAKLDGAYEKAAQVCENGILTADEVLSYLESGNSGDVCAAYAAMESRSNAAAIRALKEQENKG